MNKIIVDFSRKCGKVKLMHSVNNVPVGTKVFYRLGASIEHKKKFGTFPPADFKKWAEICEHIIHHYTQGWANEFYENHNCELVRNENITSKQAILKLEMSLYSTYLIRIKFC